MGVLLVLITIVTIYFAGSYHEASLLLLSMTLLLSEMILWLDAVWRGSAYHRDRVGVELFPEETYFLRGQWRALLLKTDNRLGRAVKVSGRLRVLDGKGKSLKVKKHRRTSWWILPGDHTAGMELRIPETGNYRLEIDRIRVYDALGLFSVSGGRRTAARITVYPAKITPDGEQITELKLAQLGTRDQDAFTDIAADNSMEIKGIREYRPEDSIRHIHWKISARLGKLQRKEYYNQNVEYPEPKAKVAEACPVKKTDRSVVMVRWDREDRRGLWGTAFAVTVCIGLLAALVYGLHVHAETVLLIILGWITLQILGAGHGTVWKGMIFGGAVFALALTAVLVLRSGIYETVFRTERFLNQVIEDESAQYMVPRTTGRIARGNRYTSGQEMIRFTSTRKLEETMYLRGFVGGSYDNGVWKAANDQSILRNHDITSETNSFQGMHYTLNRFSPEGSRQETDLHIVHANGKYDATTLYTPYFSQWMSFYYTEDDNPTWDQWYGLGKGYVYKCFEKHQMHVDWEKIDDIYAYRAQKLKRIQQEYLDAVYEEYTKVPEELVRLRRVVEENPKENVDEVTDFILKFLSEQAVYTTEPGRFTRGQDVVEQFLFEKHEGYCVHYASAAVLLYRLYGIPARYAAGYYVPADEMYADAKSGYAGAATDDRAHAWAEIYLDDYGWTPVEVTYDAIPDLAVLEPYPGYGSGESTVYGRVKQAAAETTVSLQDRKGKDTTEYSAAEIGVAAPAEEDDLAHFSVLAELWQWLFLGENGFRNRVMAAVLVGYILVVILPTVWIFHRQEERLRILEGDCGYVYGRLLALSAHAGKQKRTEQDAVRLAKMGVFSSQEIEKIIKLAEKSAFSRQGADEAETVWMREAYFRAKKSC